MQQIYDILNNGLLIIIVAACVISILRIFYVVIMILLLRTLPPSKIDAIGRFVNSKFSWPYFKNFFTLKIPEAFNRADDKKLNENTE